MAPPCEHVEDVRADWPPAAAPACGYVDELTEDQRRQIEQLGVSLGGA
jgi:hypothetical protein